MSSLTVHARCPRTCARRATLATRHGPVATPTFMPVGTLGTVKALTWDDLAAVGAQMMLANAYHLALRPGHEIVARRGGLHRFAGHDGAILTDSGGFQIYSLAHSRRVTDAGVTFRSHLDGALVELTPERLVAVQEALGPDVAMVLDECPPAQAGRAEVERAMARTTAWAERCLAARRRHDMQWFGIVQGALHEDLRAAHAATIAALPVDGVAIGGVSVGEAPADIARIVAHTAPLLPADRARYLMGVGTPQDLVRGVAAGVDMFDCVMPSRNARNGTLFTWSGRLQIKHAAWRESELPICNRCQCPVCRRYTRAYLRHLFVARELTYYRLATLHNVAFYLELMATVRAQLDAGTFAPAPLLAALDGPAAAATDGVTDTASPPR